MKCDNCGHLRRGSYEYGEYFCELGVGENTDLDKYDTVDGCRLRKRQRLRICRELVNMDIPLWWDESEEV